MIKAMKNNKIISLLIGISLLVVIFLLFINFTSYLQIGSGPNIKASNLMKNIPTEKATGMKADSKFIANTTDFSIELFKSTFSEADNSLISPISAMFPLAMLANGADGDTRSQMNQVLAKDIPLDTLNQYLFSFRRSLKSTNKSKMTIYNSIWLKDGLEVQKDFLQINSDYYDASIYQSSFNMQTLKDINNWVKYGTNGHIKKVLDIIEPDALMYLINTLAFDSKWRDEYEKEDISDDTFLNQDDSNTLCKFMSSTENYYIDDGNATGFIKPYYNNQYQFVALLPNEDTSISDYVSQMNGDSFINTIKNAAVAPVSTKIPEFHYEFSLSLKEALITLGMKDAISNNADFSRVCKSQRKSLFIDNVIQKTYIYVDPKGTKAGAATLVTVDSVGVEPDKSVILNRPFIYAIVDSKTNIPIFLGVLSDISKIAE